jgi:U3 small nucleolar RNA-associated protein 4
MLELHRSRFVEWQPAAVVALAVAPGGFTVALARENGDLEIYDTADWRCTARVPGHDGAAISSLAWCAPFDGGLEDDGGDEDAVAGAPPCRLLSAGLDGQITEWDLNTLRARGATDSHGGSVWALAAEPFVRRDRPQRVAAACDDGCVRVLTLAGGDGVGAGLSHRRSFNRVDGRILSLAWTRDARAIAAGSSRGAIHVFDCEAYAELARITVGAGDRPNASDAEERCVWALQYLPCGTLVSGSSDGDVTFWDGEHATKISAHRQHKADVLALAASPDGASVFASGVDSQIAVFEKASIDGASGAYKWTFTGTKRPHTHDVRALAMAAAPPSEQSDKSGKSSVGNAGHRGGAVLLSGGNDAQLLAYPAEKFRKRHPVRVVSVPQRTPIAMTGGGLWTDGHDVQNGDGKRRNGKKRAAGEKDAEAEQLVLARRGTPSPPLLLCDHARWLDVWRLGQGAAADFSADALAKAKRHDGTMKLSAAPRHLLRANLGGKRRTLCSAISPDGAFFFRARRVSRLSVSSSRKRSSPARGRPVMRRCASTQSQMCGYNLHIKKLRIYLRTRPNRRREEDLFRNAFDLVARRRARVVPKLTSRRLLFLKTSQARSSPRATRTRSVSSS